MRNIFSFGAGVGLALLLAPSAGAFPFPFAPPAIAAPCADLRAEDRSYTICRFDPKTDDLRLFWRGPNGQPLGSFAAAAATLAPGEKLVFAMNAGMYNDKQAPIGLYIEKGVEMKRANTRSGSGNFHLKPNGVFYFGPGYAGVMETSQFLSQRPHAAYASQSGPMLVVNGHIHPRINADGVSEKIRNGVGIGRAGEVLFAISNQPVTFHQFAGLFRDVLRCNNALFLDGSVSALYAPNLGRNDFAVPLGPMVGVVKTTP
ncbi:phosphodiester glycosidase family protein [Rhodoblastus acidophilus]|uniref:Phosphodiester glycosidase family protein n=1 Tax=Candidatus Rhodoblastus alkanivorans TaxID=2954117 RepID=A0ABS9Z3Z4_9HYPH|nr:phosphodiester glycosidase family protein [Candidatus Rhodoblastus alkanivorans]MCI4678766.1 phosphodiester glycosidase family protein [Candidatus Rhodoblastus alkanivorans]MCI4682155.1 phosphodiester glycosidase family protein [Candidatus Rhodoblastus alkanivorans]MDI4639457.1 phosphodiester glycosidase family protein [Rhodoblastus acidophilus]